LITLHEKWTSLISIFSSQSIQQSQEFTGKSRTYAYNEHMNRRNFLRSLTALSLAPIVPGAKAISAFAAPSTVGSVASDYRWAEVLVRSHKISSVSFLQRHLKINATEATSLQSQLLRNGVIGAEQNAYGFHQATKPLWDEYLPTFKERLKEMADKVIEKAQELSDESLEEDAADFAEANEVIPADDENEVELLNASEAKIQSA